jgi:hypothetical protein
MRENGGTIMNALKIAALTAVLLVLVATLANAQPQSDTTAPTPDASATTSTITAEPRAVIVTIVNLPALPLCPKKGQVVKIKILTGKMVRQVELDPRDSKEGSSPTASVSLKNDKGQLGITSGVKLQISVPDKRTWTLGNLQFPPGTEDQFLEIKLEYDPTTRTWDVVFWRG